MNVPDPSSVAVTSPIADPALLAATIHRLTASRRSLHRLLGRDAANHGFFRCVAADQIAVAHLGGTATVLGAISWCCPGRPALALAPGAVCGALGPVRGRAVLLVHRSLTRWIVPGRGSYVDAFWVHPDHRGRGLGRRLLAACAAAAPGPVWADVRSGDPRARGAFAAAGFHPAAVSPLRLAGFSRLRQGETASSL